MRNNVVLWKNVWDNPFHKLFQDVGFPSFLRKCNEYCDPHSFNLRDAGETYELELDVPGVERENLKIEVNDSRLSIQTTYEDKGENVQEQRRHSYSYYIPDIVDKKKINVVLKNGVLYITLPKNKEHAPHPIEIKEGT